MDVSGGFADRIDINGLDWVRSRNINHARNSIDATVKPRSVRAIVFADHDKVD